LPDEILEYVTSELTLRDAVRTRALSARWNRVAISSRPTLVFDWINMFETPQSSQFWNTCDEHWCPCDQFRFRFVKSVNQFLGSIERSSAWGTKEFTIRFCLGSCYQDDIVKWVRFALAKGVEKLVLRLHCVERCRKMPYDPGLIHQHNRSFPRLPPPDGSVLGPKSLHLEACCPGPSLTNNQTFGSVETLRLFYVDLRDYDLSSMFSCLKKLGVLTFEHCALPRAVNLTPLFVLESFSVVSSFGLKKITISNVKLVIFQCICRPPPELEISSRVGASNIEEFFFGSYEGSSQYVFTRLPRDMPKLRHLALYVSKNQKWADGVPASLVTFAHVTQLNLIVSWDCFALHISKIIHALKAFPRLRRLGIITKKTYATEGSIVNFKHDEHTYEHLEEIEFTGFCGTPNEIRQFLAYFEAHAPSLKQLVINRNMHSWRKNKKRLMEDYAPFLET